MCSPDSSDEINVHALKISQTIPRSLAYSYRVCAVDIGGDGDGGGVVIVELLGRLS